MKRPVLSMVAGVLVLAASLTLAAQVLAQTDPLPSWNDGAAKKAIVDFVQATTTQGNPKFVPPAERVATFDQDGTLWVEHPMYSQVIYCLDRVPAVVKAKPELAQVEPFKTVMSGNREAIAKLSGSPLEAALHRADLPADAGGAEVPARQRLQDLHRHRRRPGLRAHLCGAGVRHSARAGGGHGGGDEVRLRQERQAIPDQGAQAPAQRQQCRQARGHPPDDRPPALCGVR